MKAKLSEFEVEELVRHLFQLEDEDDRENLDNSLFEEWGIDFQTFQKICEHLVPLVAIGKSELTGKTYRGFGKNGVWLVREEVPSAKDTTSK